MVRAKGYIKNFNTIEDFKNADKSAMLTDAGRVVCSVCSACPSWSILT
jgi:ubiquitin-like modifier-activating enzyme ATG7